MSFGFSVSDFVMLAERAHTIWKQCSDAGREYQGLAGSVNILQGVLDETQIHLSKEVPDVPNRKRALVVARIACEAALDDVEALLHKYPSLGTKVNKRIIDRMKFITNDVNGLKERLATSGSNLQLCVTSLMSMSLRDVQDKVDQLLLEYKQGRREKSSVISVALVEHQGVDEDEAMQQLEDDLLEEDVHPDAIDAHHTDIRKWLLQTIQEEVLSVELERESATDTEFHTAQEYLQPETTPPEATAISPSTQLTAEGSDEDLYASSVVTDPTRGAQHYLQPSDPGRLDLLPPPSEAPSSLSRQSSIGSHASKESTWHPSNEPDPKYVAKMLVKPLKLDPLRGSIDIDSASFYFKRAFHQQDHRNRGFLTRHEVTILCREAISAVKTQISDTFLTGLIHAGDQNRDGKVDKDEFITIMHNVLDAVVTYGNEQIMAEFLSNIEHADTEAKNRQFANLATSLPWGFSRQPGPPFFDLIENTEVSSAPRMLPLDSFTLMATEVASRGVIAIDEADRHWSESVSQDLRKDFRQTLDKVRDVAIHFTTFYDTNSEDALSDLDEMLTVLYIVKAESRSSSLEDNFNTLRHMRSKCSELASHIRGYVWRVEHLKQGDVAFSPTSWPTPMTLTTDLANWKQAHMETWAWYISEQSNQVDWDAISETLETVRDWYARHHGPVQDYPSRSVRSSLSSAHHISSKAQNSLNAQAMDIARKFCAVLQDHNANERARLRGQRRRCKLKVTILGEEKRNRFSKSPKYQMKVVRHGSTFVYMNPTNLSREEQASQFELLPEAHEEIRLDVQVWDNARSTPLKEIHRLTIPYMAAHGTFTVPINNDVVAVDWKVEAPGDYGLPSPGPFPWLQLIRGYFNAEED